MAKMQAAVDAARAEGFEDSPDSEGGAGPAGRSNGAGLPSGISAALDDYEVTWGSAHEPATEPLPNLQAALAALDLARQYGSAGPSEVADVR